MCHTILIPFYIVSIPTVPNLQMYAKVISELNLMSAFFFYFRMEDARKPSDYRKRSKSFSNSDVIRSYENTLYKVRSKKWAHPLGKAMSITGHILKMAGKWGAPFTGILGSALTVGSKLLNPDPNVARYIDLLDSVVSKKL